MLIGRLTEFIINKYQTAVDQFWLTETDWRRQWLTDCWSCTAFCCNIFSLLRQLCTVGWDFLYGRCKRLFVIELNNAYFSRHLFLNNVWVAKFCITVCFTYSLSIAIFEHRYFTRSIGQGKSVNISRSYGQEYGVLFFWLAVYIVISLKLARRLTLE